MSTLSDHYQIAIPYKRSERAQELLRGAAERIENQPERYNQKTWGAYIVDVGGHTTTVSFASAYGYTEEDALRAGREHFPSAVSSVQGVPEGACNTAFCIAGHLLLEAGYGYQWDARAYQTRGRWEAVADFSFVTESEEGVNDPGSEAAGLLSLEEDPNCDNLFREDWRPVEGMPVPDALRLIADGASVPSVTHDDFAWEDNDDD